MNDTSNPNNNAKPLSPFLKDENYKPTPQFSGMPNTHTASAPVAPVNLAQKPAPATPPTTSYTTPHIESSVKPFIPQAASPVASSVKPSMTSSVPSTSSSFTPSASVSSAPSPAASSIPSSFASTPATASTVINQPYVNLNGKSVLSESQFSVAIKEAAKKAESQPYTSQFTKPSMKTNTGSSKGILSSIIFIVIICLLAAALWFFKPVNLSDITKSIQNAFSGIFSSKSAGTIEDKLSDANNNQSGDSLPNSVFDSQSKPSKNTKTVKTTKSDPFANPTTSNTDSASNQDKITTYLKKNINKIAKTTGYVVTGVEFDGPSRAVVSYEKGSIYKSAIVTTSIGSAGGVKITSFTPLTK